MAIAVGSLSHAALAGDRAVDISFELTAGGMPAGCGAVLEGIGADHLKAGLNDARIYVHDVKLIGGNGKRIPLSLDQSEWQYGGVALLDFKDARGGSAPCSAAVPAKNTAVRGHVAAGSYRGLEFTVGVPVEAEVGGKKVQLNHSNLETAPAPLDVTVMNWSWQAGRKFLLVEVNPEGGFKRADGSPGRTWMVHLGSTGCTGNPATGDIVSCTRPNRFKVTFDAFDPEKDAVAIDLAVLFKGSDLKHDKGGAIGCMSGVTDPECPAIFAALGLDLDDAPSKAGDTGHQTKNGESPIFKVLSRR